MSLVRAPLYPEARNSSRAASRMRVRRSRRLTRLLVTADPLLITVFDDAGVGTTSPPFVASPPPLPRRLAMGRTCLRGYCRHTVRGLVAEKGVRHGQSSVAGAPSRATSSGAPKPTPP